VSTLLCLYATFVLAVDVQVYPSVLTKIGSNSMEQGLLLSFLFLLFPLSSVLSGVMSDRIGKKAVLITGGLFLTLPFAISASVDQFWIRTLAVLLFGFGIGAVESQSVALLADKHPGKERSIINIAQLVFSIGAAGGPFLIGLAFSHNPALRLQSFLWAIAAGTLTLVIGFFLLRDGNSAAAALEKGGFRQVLADPVGRLLLVAMFMYTAPEMGTAGWLPKYAEVHLYLSSGIAPISLTLFWAGLGFSRALVGFLLYHIQDTHLLIIALCLTLLARCAAFMLNMPMASMVLFFFIGAGMGTVWPTFVAMIGRRFKHSSGSAFGLIIAVGGLAVPIMHQIIGVLSREEMFGLRYTLLGLGIFTLGNMFVVRWIGQLEKGGAVGV
jgi:fucose permease